MFDTQTIRMFAYAVECRSCHEVIAAPVRRLPEHAIICACSACGDRRWYLPEDVFGGRPVSFTHRPKPVRSVGL